MENAETLRYRFDSFDLILFVKRKIKILTILSLASAIISSIISLTITEKYKSTVILFPTSSGSISKALLTDNVAAKSILQFGEEEEVEQMLQVLQSDEILKRVVDKHKLMEHYEINPKSKYPMTELMVEYNNNISIDRTEYMSVEIEVLDKDPQMAADIANDIAAFLDTVMNRMQKQRALLALQIVREEYNGLQHEIQLLEDSLVELRNLGIYDYEAQAEVFSDAYAQAIAKNANSIAVKELESKLKVLATYGGNYVSIRDFLEYEKEHLSKVKAKYAEAKVDAEQILPHSFIVNSAYKAEHKSYPIRWLIVVVSTAVSGILAFLLLVVMEVFRTKEI